MVKKAVKKTSNKKDVQKDLDEKRYGSYAFLINAFLFSTMLFAILIVMQIWTNLLSQDTFVRLFGTYLILVISGFLVMAVHKSVHNTRKLKKDGFLMD